MKIIHISHVYHPSEGGVQFWFKNVSERLVAQYGDDVTVVTTDTLYGPERALYKKIEPAEEIINGVKVIRFSYRRWHIKYYRYFFKLIKKLGLLIPESLVTEANGPISKGMIDYLMQTNADAICASSSPYYYMQLPLWKKCNFFYWGCLHLSNDPNSRVLNDIQFKSIKASQMYLANTNYEKKRLIAAGISARKITVIGAGVDQKQFEIESSEINSYRRRLGIPDQAFLIGYVGRIEKTKNILLLIKSFQKLVEEDKNLYLLIAGSGSNYVEELQNYCNELPAKIANRIKWKVNFDLNEKAALFHSLDVLVLPSNNESFGIVFLEAWICKKPVIGTSIGAVKDVIDEHENGLLMKINDVDSLCEQLKKLINNKDLRDKLGECGYNKVKENFTWDVITSRVRQCYISGTVARQNKSYLTKSNQQ